MTEPDPPRAHESQETTLFNQLWAQLGDGSSIITDPVTWNLQEYIGGDTIENRTFELQVDHIEMEPQSVFQQLIPNPDPSTDSGVLYSASEMTTSPASTFSPGGTSENGAASQTLPSNQNYEGEYNFSISLGQQTQQAAKSISWTYSSQLHKLFVDRDKPCPIHFKTATTPPTGSCIRALPIFKKAESIQEVVKRCPNHVGENDEESRNHLIMCSDPEAAYTEDPTTGRFSVTVPHKMPQVGADSVQYLLTFKCFQSCVGGLNRRPIQTVFTLEHEGKILGRQVLDVRICACPGRDRKAEEKSKSEKTQKKTTKRGTSKITQEVSITSLSKKRKIDKELYTITVEGREKYEILLKIKQALDLMEYINPEQMKAYKEHESQVAKTLLEQLLGQCLPRKMGKKPRTARDK